MGGVEVGNWFGDAGSRPAVIVEAETAEEIAAILRDRERYPNPVRAAGSNHAATACGAAHSQPGQGPVQHRGARSESCRAKWYCR